MLKMESINVGRSIYQPKIWHGTKNPPKIIDNYEDCDVQVEYNYGENLKFAKMFSKVIRKLDKISRKKVHTNVKNI